MHWFYHFLIKRDFLQYEFNLELYEANQIDIYLMSYFKNESYTHI